MHPESTQSSPEWLVASSEGVGFVLRNEQAGGWPHPEGLAPWVSLKGQRHQSPLQKATARRSSKKEDHCCCPRWTQAGVEPGWQRKHLERHWEEGRRNEREERARHANSSALPPYNQNRFPSRLRPVRKEIGEESRVSAAMVRH